MRTRVGLFVLIACLALAASCGGQSIGIQRSKPFFFSDVACPKRSSNALSSKAANVVIRSEAEFRAAWSDLGYEENDEMPQADFSKGPLLMVFGGQRSTSNEWVVVNHIEQLANNELLVTYNNFTANHPGCGGPAVVSYPFCIVQVSTDAAKVSFQSNELNACDVTDKPEL